MVKLSPRDVEYYKLASSWRCVKLTYPKGSKATRAGATGEYRLYMNYSPNIYRFGGKRV